MATIYDLSTGRIISENRGITTVETHVSLPDHDIALQPVRQSCTPAGHPAMDEYMCLIQELLKKL